MLYLKKKCFGFFLHLQVEVWEPLEKEKLKQELTRILEKGINSLAVVLMHSYTFVDHEKEVGKLARELGFTHVSLSHEAMPMVRIVPRGYTGNGKVVPRYNLHCRLSSVPISVQRLVLLHNYSKDCVQRLFNILVVRANTSIGCTSNIQMEIDEVIENKMPSICGK